MLYSIDKMSPENGTYFGGITPETDPTAKYEALIDEILEEAEDDPYWTTSKKLEDGENGLPPITILSTLLRITDKLQAMEKAD